MRKPSVLVLFVLIVVLCNRYQALDGQWILDTSDDSVIETVRGNTIEPTDAVQETICEVVTAVTEQTEQTVLTEYVESTENTAPVSESKSVKETAPTEGTKPMVKSNDQYSDDESYAGFFGRLYVPDAGIDVALYQSYDQSVTDRADSAKLFSWGNYSGEIIADHSNQEFAKLFNVKVGTQGYIRSANGVVINIKCVAVFNGHNTGSDLVDESGVSAMGRADYAMYTCRNGWQNVRICLWDIF